MCHRRRNDHCAATSGENKKSKGEHNQEKYRLLIPPLQEPRAENIRSLILAEWLRWADLAIPVNYEPGK